MGSKGSNTTTTAQTPPPQVLAAYQNVVNQAQNVAGAPLQQYQGPMVAGFSPLQQQAITGIQNNQGVANPYINAAAQLDAGATQPITPMAFSGDAVNAYQSPYTQQVIQSTMANMQESNAEQQQGLVGNAISAGAWGGDRAAVAQGEMGRQQALAGDQTIAQLENQGYSQALGEFNQQQQTGVGAQEASQWLGTAGASGLANLGNLAQSTSMADTNQMLGAGTLEQQLEQAQLNIPYEQFQQQQAYPFQTTQYLAGITEGTGSQSGGTGSTTSPGPNQTATDVGAATSLASLGLLAYMAAKRGGRVEQREHHQSGGVAGMGRYAYDIGGGIGGGVGTPLSNVPDPSKSFVPTLGASTVGGRNGLPPPPPAMAQPDGGAQMQQQAMQMAHLANSAKQQSAAKRGNISSAGSNGIPNPTQPPLYGTATGDQPFMSNGMPSGAYFPAGTWEGSQAGIGGYLGSGMDQSAMTGLDSSAMANIDAGAAGLHTGGRALRHSGGFLSDMSPAELAGIGVGVIGLANGIGEGSDDASNAGSFVNGQRGGRIEHASGGGVAGFAPPPRFAVHPVGAQMTLHRGPQFPSLAEHTDPGSLGYRRGGGVRDRFAAGGAGYTPSNGGPAYVPMPTPDSVAADMAAKTAAIPTVSPMTPLAAGGANPPQLAPRGMNSTGNNVAGFTPSPGRNIPVPVLGSGRNFPTSNPSNIPSNLKSDFSPPPVSAAPFSSTPQGFTPGNIMDITSNGMEFTPNAQGNPQPTTGIFAPNAPGNPQSVALTGVFERGGRVHRDMGGSTGYTQAGDTSAGNPLGGGNPNLNTMLQKLMQQSPEQLQEMAQRAGPNSQMGSIAQRALQIKRMNPSAGQPTGAQPGVAPQAPQAGMAPMAASGTQQPGQQTASMQAPMSGMGMPYGMRRGGRARFDDGGDVSYDPMNGVPIFDLPPQGAADAPSPGLSPPPPPALPTSQNDDYTGMTAAQRDASRIGLRMMDVDTAGSGPGTFTGVPLAIGQGEHRLIDPALEKVGGYFNDPLPPDYQLSGDANISGRAGSLSPKIAATQAAAMTELTPPQPSAADEDWRAGPPMVDDVLPTIKTPVGALKSSATASLSPGMGPPAVSAPADFATSGDNNIAGSGGKSIAGMGQPTYAFPPENPPAGPHTAQSRNDDGTFGKNKLFNLAMALGSVGAGMMASRSHYFGQALGEGLESGIKTLSGEIAADREQGNKQGELDLRARGLDQAAEQAKQTNARLTEEHGDNLALHQDAQRDSVDLRRLELAQRMQSEQDRSLYQQQMLASGRYQYQPGTRVNPDTGETENGMWKLPTRGDEQPQFTAGSSINNKSGGRGSMTGDLANQLVTSGAAKDLPTALAMIKDPSGRYSQTINNAAENRALAAAKADPKWNSDPNGTLTRWRGSYGLSAAPQQQQRPTAQQQQAAPVAPPAEAIGMLRNNPALKSAFDAKYGAGAADRALSGQ